MQLLPHWLLCQYMNVNSQVFWFLQPLIRGSSTIWHGPLDTASIVPPAYHHQVVVRQLNIWGNEVYSCGGHKVVISRRNN